LHFTLEHSYAKKGLKKTILTHIFYASFSICAKNFLLELLAKLMTNLFPNLSRKIGKNRQKYSVFPEEENISFSREKRIFRFFFTLGS